MSTTRTRRLTASARDYTLMTVAAVLMFAPIYYLLIGSLKPPTRSSMASPASSRELVVRYLCRRLRRIHAESTVFSGSSS